MTEEQQRGAQPTRLRAQATRLSAETARLIRAFLATYDGRDASNRQIASLIRARLHSELYRREREHYPEYVDVGGEG